MKLNCGASEKKETGFLKVNAKKLERRLIGYRTNDETLFN